MLFLLNLQLFQRTAKKTSDTLWSRRLIPPQQARKNRADCTIKRQTSSLRKLGAKLTYSGDSPFLLGLVVGVSNEQSSSDTFSRLPLYVQMTLHSCAHKVASQKLEKITELKVPFRKELPKMSLVGIEDIRCNCPDATHMTTQCLETNLRKWSKK